MWGRNVKSHISLWGKMFIFHATHLLIKAWKIGAYKWRGLFIEVEDRLPYFITKLLSSFCLKTSNATYLYNSSYCSKTNSLFLIFIINMKRDSDWTMSVQSLSLFMFIINIRKRDSDWTMSVHPFPISFMFRNQSILCDQRMIHTQELNILPRHWYLAQVTNFSP